MRYPPIRAELLLLLTFAALLLTAMFELNDDAIYQASGQLLSGHSLKHLAAALAAWPVIDALARRAGGQNALQAAGAAA